MPGEQKVCPACHVAHHKGCWLEQGGCTTAGCGQGPGEAPAPEEPPATIPIQVSETPPKIESPSPAGSTTEEPRRKLGMLVSVAPGHPNFEHGMNLAAAAMRADVEVYLYCLDDAVLGINDPRLQSMRGAGLRLFGCEFARRQRRMPPDELAIYGGLTMLSDLAAATDRFVSFN